MRSTDILREEHEAILKMLNIIDVVSERLESGERVDTEHLEQILEFVRVFSDRCHHGKEEKVLFPAMEEEGVPRAGPIMVMLMEHELGRGYVRGMAEALDLIKAGEGNASRRFVENARNYVGLLRQHIEKENEILFKIAEMHIPKDKDDELLENFEKIERERIGPRIHEESERTLETLEEIYLKRGPY